MDQTRSGSSEITDIKMKISTSAKALQKALKITRTSMVHKKHSCSLSLKNRAEMQKKRSIGSSLNRRATQSPQRRVKPPTVREAKLLLLRLGLKKIGPRSKTGAAPPAKKENNSPQRRQAQHPA